MTIKPAVKEITKSERAVILRRVDDFLVEAVELTIIAGKVVDERKLTRGPDLLNIAEMHASIALIDNVRPK